MVRTRTQLQGCVDPTISRAHQSIPSDYYHDIHQPSASQRHGRAVAMNPIQEAVWLLGGHHAQDTPRSGSTGLPDPAAIPRHPTTAPTRRAYRVKCVARLGAGHTTKHASMLACIEGEGRAVPLLGHGGLDWTRGAAWGRARRRDWMKLELKRDIEVWACNVETLQAFDVFFPAVL